MTVADARVDLLILLFVLVIMDVVKGAGGPDTSAASRMCFVEASEQAANIKYISKATVVSRNLVWIQINIPE